MLTIATLLRSGGEYRPEHVARLQQQCQVIPHHRFVCLSDVAVPCERIPLQHTWARWWGQLELFRAGLFDGPVLYMDLDTTVLRDTEIPVANGDFWALECPRGHFPTSGIMSWWGDFSHIYLRNMDTHKPWQRWVNEGIFPHVTPRIIQRELPGFYSYKFEIRGKRALPEDVRVVYWHGRPRPWDKPREIELDRPPV